MFTTLLLLIGCYKQVSIYQEMQSVRGPLQQGQYCSQLESPLNFRPQKYTGDKLYQTKTEGVGNRRLIADVAVPFGSNVSSLQIIPRAEWNGAQIFVSLLPTQLEYKENMATEISISQKLADNLPQNFTSSNAVDIQILPEGRLSQRRRELRSIGKDPFVFRIEIGSSNQEELIQTCSGTLGCPLQIKATYRNNYNGSLQMLSNAMYDDLAELDKYLVERASSKQVFPPKGVQTPEAIQDIKQNYGSCLTQADTTVLDSIENNFEKFYREVLQVWNNQGFDIVNTRETIETLRSHDSYLAMHGVAVSEGEYSQHSELNATTFSTLYAPQRFPHLYEQVEASQQMWDYEKEIDNRSRYLGDNIGWACWLFAQPKDIRSTCYDKMLSLQQLAVEQQVSVVDIAAKQVKQIQSFSEQQRESQYPLSIDTFSGLKLLRYSTIETPRHRLCYGYNSSIPSKNKMNDEKVLLSSIKKTGVIKNAQDFQTWVDSAIPVLQYICDTADITVPTIDQQTLTKELGKIDTLADLHDFLNPWLVLRKSIDSALPNEQILRTTIHQRIQEVIFLVDDRAESLLQRFSTPQEYKKMFCNDKAHVLMQDMLSKSRGSVIPSVNSRYSRMVQRRMLNHGVEATLSEIGGGSCAVNDTSSFFDCNPALVIDLSKEMNTGCNQSKCQTFKKDVEALKKRSESDACLDVTGNIVCNPPTIYPQSSLSVEAPWRNTGTTKVGQACFQCVSGQTVTVQLNKQGFAGDRYVLYSNKSFSVNGNDSSVGSCKTVKEKDIPKNCNKRIFKVSGSASSVYLVPASDKQCFYIEGI